MQPIRITSVQENFLSTLASASYFQLTLIQLQGSFNSNNTSILIFVTIKFT